MNNIYENKFIKSDDDMAELLAGGEFPVLPDALLKEDRYSNGTDVIGFFPKTDKYDAFIMVGIQNFEILETEQYKYSVKDFIKILNKVKEYYKNNPERLEKYEKLIKKYESYIAENQTES